MKVLLTGSTGYIGKRLLQNLSDNGHDVTCFVRSLERLIVPVQTNAKVVGHEIDLLKPIPDHLHSLDIDVAFYLVHSMSSSIGQFMEEEALSARNFATFISKTNCKQIIYLSGISNSPKLSRHLQSRKNVENILRESRQTSHRLAGRYYRRQWQRIFRDHPRSDGDSSRCGCHSWVKTLCQPLGVADVLKYLTGCMLNPKTYDDIFDIGGPEILSYKEMLLQYAEVRGLKRWIGVVPFFSPRMSSYWLYFVTSTSYYLAANLVDSMKVEVVCKDNRLQQMLGIEPLTYREACRRALIRINLDTVASSWTDAVSMTQKQPAFRIPGCSGFWHTPRSKKPQN